MCAVWTVVEPAPTTLKNMAAARELGLNVLETHKGEKVDANEALKGKIVG